MRRQAIIHWGVSSFFGWGVYGLNLARAWVDDPELEPLAALPVREQDLVVDPLVRRVLEPFLGRSRSLQAQLRRHAGTSMEARAAVLHALGNDLAAGPAAHDVRLSGRPTIGVAFFETALLTPEAVARARSLDLVVAGSTWNADVLRAHGLGNVRTVIQGVVEALDDDRARSAVPGEGDRHDPELILDWSVEWKVVAVCRGRLFARGAARHLVEDVVDPVGEDGHLLLLERDRRDRSALAGLEKEDPLTGRPDGARDETLGGVELEDRHSDDTNPLTRPVPSRHPHPPQRRRGARVPRRRSATVRRRS